MSRRFIRANADQIAVGSANALTGRITFGSWVRFISYPTGGFFQWPNICKSAAAITNRNYCLDFRTNGSSQITGCASWSSGGVAAEFHTANLTDQGIFGWHQVVWLIDFSTNPYQLQFYLDGRSFSISQISGPTSGAPNTASQSAYIGYDGGSTWDGAMQEVFLTTDWLSPGEILALARGEPTYDIIKRHPLELYAPLGVGMTETDLSPNRHSLTLTGTQLDSPASLKPMPSFRRPFFSLPSGAPFTWLQMDEESRDIQTIFRKNEIVGY